jgi:SAM-dependent methyltransferase
MAKTYPNSNIVGYDYHADSIRTARERAAAAGVTNVRFEVADAVSYRDESFDLIAFFDCLHDMGDPVGVSRHARRALKDDGTVMIVEPFANDNVQDNLNPVGRVMYGASSQICTLKTPYRDGTTHVLFEPLDFLARLAALVPSPGVNLTRFHWRHPCLQPCGRPAAAQIGNPADLSWGVCAESRLASADRAGPARARRSWYSRAGQCDTEARIDELGTALETRVRRRDSALRSLRWRGEDHCQHRRPRGHRQNSSAPGA